MPIVIDRKTGEILHKPNYTPEQIFSLQAAYIKAWAESHKDVLASPESVQEYIDQHKKQGRAGDGDSV